LNLLKSLTPTLILLLSVGSLPVAAQGWDPVKDAVGWASFDRDGSCVFHEATSQKLLVWSKETGISDMVDLARLNAKADHWVLDPLGNAWVVAGTSLQKVEKNGKLGTSFTLPTEVADLAWDTRGFLLCFQSREPYLERRDMKTGSVVWTFGPKPPKGSHFPQIRHHVAIQEDGKILLNSGDDLHLIVLEPASGSTLDVIPFKINGQPSPQLNLGEGNRGALAWWLNTNTALAAVPASQLGGAFQGLVLAKLDLTKREMALIPTGSDEKATLLGIQDDKAVLELPGGGLTFFPIP
jgi:hypothetical protein